MTSSIPPKMEAVVTADVHTTNVQLVDTPKPGKGEVLVQNRAVTLNPTDWKHVAFLSPPGVIVGCDFAGVVAALGEGVENGLKVGDRVSGFVHGAKHAHNGSFAHFLTAKAQNTMLIPDSLKDEEAASMGIAGETAVQALFQRLELPAPPKDIRALPEVTSSSPKLLVWSGSTAVGQYAIQLGRIAGYYVVTTASPRNHAFVKELGAQEAYDYADEDTPSKISEKHKDLALALDCISENGSQQKAINALGKDKPGKLIVLLAPDKEAAKIREDVQIIHTLIYSALGDTMSFGKRVYDAAEVGADHAWMRAWLDGANGLLHALFAAKLLRPNRIRLEQGGLHAIQEGMDRHRKGVSAEKLAYTISV